MILQISQRLPIAPFFFFISLTISVLSALVPSRSVGTGRYLFSYSIVVSRFSGVGVKAADSTCNSLFGSSNEAINRQQQSRSLMRMSDFKSWDAGRDLAIEKCVIPMSSESYKGSSGRVGVLGGSARYTGAPYYAAMAALKAGADLSYVFCAQEAAIPIKGYSPELMVAPVYSATEFDKANSEQEPNDSGKEQLIEAMVNEVTSSIDRLHALVIGPGLGRCPLVFEATARIIKHAQSLQLALVIDADALFMLSLPKYHSLLQGYDKVVLTPNIVEYKRLFHEENFEGTNSSPQLQKATVIQKGKNDVISVNKGSDVRYICEEVGGLKRSGGIGDVLAGTLGTLVAWHVILKRQNFATDEHLQLSCWTGCCFVKRATKIAFESKRRSMTAPDVLDSLGYAIDIMTTAQEKEQHSSSKL